MVTLAVRPIQTMKARDQFIFALKGKTELVNTYKIMCKLI